MLHWGYPQRRRFRQALGSAVGMAGVAIALQSTGALQFFEKAALDQFFRLRNASAEYEVSVPLTLITVSEADLKTLPQWPLTDAQLAEALDKIRQGKPAVVGLNLHRNLPVGSGQAQLKRLFTTTPNLIAVEKTVADSQAAEISAPQTLEALGQVASSDLIPDPDGKIRRHLLSLGTHEGKRHFSLGARLALEYLAQQGVEQELSQTDSAEIRLGQAVFEALTPADGGYAGADVGGYQILANFYPAPEVFERASLTELLAGEVPERLLRDRIVLLGVTAPSLQNPFFIPSTRSPEQAWYGVELQADLASQMIAAAQGERSPLQGVSMGLGWLWIVLWAGGSAVIAAYLPMHRSSLLALPCGLLGLWGASYFLFLQGWWIVVAAPGVALVGAGLLSRRLMWGKAIDKSRNQLRFLEHTLEGEVAARTQSLKAENLSLSQAKSRAEQANQSKSEFLARMSHELRIPLNSMLGFSRMMQDDPGMDESNKENLDIIHASGEHLLTLVNDVLDISRIEANQLSLKDQVINLSNLFERLESMLKLQAKEKGLSFRCTMDSRLPQYILGDETRLLQVLINLLGNAIKFTRAGHVILRAWTLDDDSKQLYLEVEDTGMGISAADAEQIFEPFAQCSDSDSKLPGTGLGLFISQQLVRRMGGNIALRSQLGKGTKFKVSLPLRQAEPASVVAAAQKSQSLEEEQLGYRVLVVDDVAFNRKLLAKLLTDIGFEVREAKDGEAAIYLWESWKPQLMMMDIYMPAVNGYEVTQHIRLQEMNRGLSPTPILAVSGAATAGEQVKALSAGFNGLLHKPFERSQLLAAIAQVLVPSVD